MNSMLNQALRAYTQVEVETVIGQASAHKLVLMLFEGAIKSTHQAILLINLRDIPGKGEAISRTIRIIEEGLKCSLDFGSGGVLAEQLDALYNYMLRRLLEASLRNEIAPLEEVAKLLSELRDAWAGMPQTSVTPSTELATASQT